MLFSWFLDNHCYGADIPKDCQLSADPVNDDVDKTQDNWYFERAEDREYHHDEPDDWFFRRKQEQEVKISKRLHDIDNQVFGSHGSQNGGSQDTYQGHDEEYDFFDYE